MVHHYVSFVVGYFPDSCGCLMVSDVRKVGHFPTLRATNISGKTKRQNLPTASSRFDGWAWWAFTPLMWLLVLSWRTQKKPGGLQLFLQRLICGNRSHIWCDWFLCNRKKSPWSKAKTRVIFLTRVSRLCSRTCKLLVSPKEPWIEFKWGLIIFFLPPNGEHKTSTFGRLFKTQVELLRKRLAAVGLFACKYLRQEENHVALMSRWSV